ncbi:MAG: hypothetical protein K4571_17630 [Deltaproteobacteria bacterium]
MDIPNKYKIKNKIWIEPEMFYSEAFRDISKSGSAIVTLMRCLQKRKWETTKINKKRVTIFTDDGFTFPYAEAAGLGICKKTQFWKNILKLVEVGFLDMVHQGGWYRKYEKVSDFSVYKYSERWRKYRTPEFVVVEKPKVLPEHFHVRANIERQKSKVTSLKRTSHVHDNEHDRVKTDYRRVHDNEQSGQTIETCQNLAATL